MEYIVQSRATPSAATVSYHSSKSPMHLPKQDFNMRYIGADAEVNQKVRSKTRQAGRQAGKTGVVQCGAVRERKASSLSHSLTWPKGRYVRQYHTRAQHWHIRQTRVSNRFSNLSAASKVKKMNPR